MTISTLTNRASYIGAGLTGPFAIPFPIQNTSDLRLIRTSVSGADSILVLNTDYTVSGLTSVTLTTALASGEILTIRRAPPLTQPMSIRNQGTYFPSTIEDEFDRVVEQLQDLRDRIDRSPQLLERLDPALLSLSLVPETGKVLAWASPTQLGNATVDSTGIVVPAGRTDLTASAFLARNAVYNVEDFAAGGVTIGLGNAVNDMAALNAAIAAAGTTGLVYARPGLTLTTTATTVFKGPVEMTGATINYTGSGVAVQVGDGTNILADTCVKLPRVSQAAKTGLGWGTFGGTDISASVGVKVMGFYEGEIHVPWVNNFAVGLLEYGIAAGSAYTTFYLGHLFNNQVNHKLDGDPVVGWVNENLHLGGRMSHNSAELQSPNTNVLGQPGTRQIQIKPLNPAISSINNHRWIGTSLEGDTPEYMVEIDGGTNNLFDFCRYEATHPKVKVNGATAVDNEFRGGIQLDAVAFTFVGVSPGDTKVQHSGGLRWVPGDAATRGALVIGNGFSSANPTMTILNSGLDPNNFGTTWCVQLGAQRLKGKQQGDAEASPKVDINFDTGLIAATRIGVGNSGAATTPGSVVKKIEVFDMAGVSLGFIPVYSTIT